MRATAAGTCPESLDHEPGRRQGGHQGRGKTSDTLSGGALPYLGSIIDRCDEWFFFPSICCLPAAPGPRAVLCFSAMQPTLQVNTTYSSEPPPVPCVGRLSRSMSCVTNCRIQRSSLTTIDDLGFIKFIYYRHDYFGRDVRKRELPA
ncbi:6-hydroxynicotinate 3-monooxygenase [Tolypocladium paradoxum]|uniref:6-hydroxynicotinate 3-monooxygenase n=1 Tax=Tolypocladium paradoxum TaxID=94208 RepID=A0A2S4KTZ7_9HYPO|nr:6-hydroxynicotinate 3-monooxygenase [Tolypocladium paradoxum]